MYNPKRKLYIEPERLQKDINEAAPGSTLTVKRKLCRGVSTIAVPVSKSGLKIIFPKGFLLTGRGSYDMFTVGDVNSLGDINGTSGVQSNIGTITCTAPAAGTQTLASLSSNLTSGKYYFIFSGFAETHRATVNLRRLVGGQLVKATGTNTIDKPIANLFLTPTILDITSRVLTDFEMENFRAEGVQTTQSSALLIGLIDKLTLRGVNVGYCSLHGFQIQHSREGTVTNWSSIHIGQGTFSGQGYHAEVNRSTNIQLINGYSRRGRHGCSIAAGCGGVTVDGLYSKEHSDSSADSHGGNNFNCILKGVTGTHDIKLGNTSWTGGVANWSVLNSNFVTLQAIGAIRDTLVKDCSYKQFYPFADTGDRNTLCNGGEFPVCKNVTLENCTIDMGATAGAAISEYLNTSTDVYGFAPAYRGFAGTTGLLVKNCTLKSQNGSYHPAVSLLSPLGISSSKVTFEGGTAWPSYENPAGSGSGHGSGQAVIQINTNSGMTTVPATYLFTNYLPYKSTGMKVLRSGISRGYDTVNYNTGSKWVNPYNTTQTTFVSGDFTNIATVAQL